MKLVVSSSVLAFVLAIPGVAAAQSAPGGSSCPPGSWFCAEPPDAKAAPAGKPVGLDPLPEPSDEPPAQAPRRAPTVTYQPAPSSGPPPVVVYQPPPPVMGARPEAPPPYEYEPPPPHRPLTPPQEWGVNLHLEGAMLGSGTRNDAGMGGLGAGLRFKPSRHFGLETTLDFVGGHGYAGDLRNETALSFNGLIFLNPQDRFQVYLLGGFGWAWAHSRNDPSDPTQSAFDANYAYFGGQAGVGLELRVTRVLAFNVDFRGFIRSRTDALAQTQPEFTSTTGQQTNTSGGGLLTAGMTLYF